MEKRNPEEILSSTNEILQLLKGYNYTDAKTILENAIKDLGDQSIVN